MYCKTQIAPCIHADLTNKASQSHSVLNSLLNQSQDFSGHHHHHHPHPSDFAGMHPHPHRVLPTANMRMPPHAAPKPSDVTPSGSVYPHYNLPHGKYVQTSCIRCPLYRGCNALKYQHRILI